MVSEWSGEAGQTEKGFNLIEGAVPWGETGFMFEVLWLELSYK